MASRRSFFRRKQPIVASGQRIDLGNDKAIQAVLSSRQNWQKQAFDAADAVGEIHYGVNVQAALMSRLVIYAAEIPDAKDAKPVRTTNSDAIGAIERLGTFVQRADLQRELTVHLLVPGEGYLVGIQPGEGRDNEEEIWEMASIEEVDKGYLPDGKATLKLLKWTDEGKDILLNPDAGDVFIRIWRQSPRHRQQADSHVRAILNAADELLWWDAAAMAAAKNRLSLAGLFAFPSDMELPAETEEESKLSGSHRLIKRLMEAARLNIQNPGEASAAVPIFTTYPANDQRKSGIDAIEVNRPQDELLEKRTDRALTRIAQGLNLPVEVITGLGSSTHWAGGQVTESQFREHVEPLAVLLVNALTNAYLHPMLKKMGTSDPSNFIVWYDAANLILHADQARNVIRAVELGASSLPALRRVIGLSESDAPTDEEKEDILTWLASVRRGTGQQGIVANPQKSEEPDGGPTQLPKQNAPGDRTPVEQPAAPLKGRGQSTTRASGNGHDLQASVCLELVSRLQTLTDEKVRRALEKAGNKLRSRANKSPAYKAIIRGVGPMDVAATLGREAVTKLGSSDLFDGCFDDIPARFHSWADKAMETLDLATPPLRPDSTKVLVEQLKVLAADALFSPTLKEPLVPATYITDALVSAGYFTAIVLPSSSLAV